MSNDILVSIVCNTYNHEKYIKSAIEGFVMQKTNFKYEILIHDDASTDSTQLIIETYVKKFPNLIKPYYQKENQYSKGIDIGNVFQYPRAQGKYIALCEGDDYWIDPLKLQKQVDALEQNKNCDVCACSAYVLNEKGEKEVLIRSKKNTTFLPDDVILGGGGFVATASLMFRKSIITQIPPYRERMSFDYVIQIQGSLRGGMIYLADIMCVYRILTEHSWTKRMKNHPEKLIQHKQRVMQMLECLNECTNFEYNDSIQKRVLEIKFSLLEKQKKYDEMLQRKYKILYDKCSLKRKIFIRIKARICLLKNVLQKGEK